MPVSVASPSAASVTCGPDGAGWTEPELLRTVNSARDEYHASFSPDGATMFFVRDGALHQIPTSGTGLTPGR